MTGIRLNHPLVIGALGGVLAACMACGILATGVAMLTPPPTPTAVIEPTPSGVPTSTPLPVVPTVTSLPTIVIQPTPTPSVAMDEAAYIDIIEPAVIRTKRDYPMQPRFEYRCGNQCQSRSRHDQQLLEWGCFEFIKKCHDYNQIHDIWRNMGIGNKEWRHFFVVGNQANQRTSFMVINVIRQKITDVQSMIPFDRL